MGADNRRDVGDGGSMRDRKTAVIRSALLVTAAACIIAGAVRGETQTVLTKAINICLECIGIG